MHLYPAIDLRGGRCVRLHQGDFSRETVYDDDPVARARSFAEAGAHWIHVVDLDGARGAGSNRDVVAAIADSVGVPVQTGGGVRDATLLEDTAVARIVLGSLAVSQPDVAQALSEQYPEQVAIGLDHWDGEVRVRGWQEGAGVDVLEAVAWPAFANVAAVIVTAITQDATMSGPDLGGLAQVVEATRLPVIASGGVGSLDDIRALRDTGVAGVIVGKALYERRFTVEQAVAICAE